MSKAKYIPNIITFIRVLLCIALIFIQPAMGILSFTVYCIAGFTDMIDGPLARKIPGAQTKLGADLDSVADMFLILVSIFVLLPAMDIYRWLPFVAMGLLTYRILCGVIIGLIKHKKALFIHTIGNKILALLLFLIPILYFILGPSTIINTYIIFVASWGFLSITEEAVINILLKKPNENLRGLWKLKEENKK